MSAPTPRWRVAAWALVGVVAVAALVGLTEWLRHPGDPVPIEEPVTRGDPLRDPVECPVPAGREDQDRPAAPADAAARQVTTARLLDCPQAWDGRNVLYRGEVVGALLPQAEGTWAQVNDDVYAGDVGALPGHRGFVGGNAGVGVLLPDELAARIATVGGPGVRGDVVEVVGTFQRVDRRTGEIAVIRANDLRVLEPGGPLERPSLPERPVVAALVAAAAIAVVVGERRARARR